MSEILEIAHDMGCDLAEVGATDANTMRELDALCLPLTSLPETTANHDKPAPRHRHRESEHDDPR